MGDVKRDRDRGAESVYISRNLRTDDDVISPPPPHPGHYAEGFLTSLQEGREYHREMENFSGTQRARGYCLLSPPSMGPRAQLRVTEWEGKRRTGLVLGPVSLGFLGPAPVL